MTRENAIEWFAMLKEKFVNTVYEKYLEMAIEALKQQRPKVQYERYLPCTCGANRRHIWYTTKTGGKGHVITLVCKRCGRRVEGRNHSDAKCNWNLMIKEAQACGEKIEL